VGGGKLAAMEANPSRPDLAAAAEIAADQYGLLTRAQALDAGMTARAIERQLATGAWVRVRQGVYRSAWVRSTWHQRALAACLGSTGPVAVSHRAAAYLHGLLERAPARIDVVVPRADGASERRRLATVHRTRALCPEEVVVIEGVPATCLARTLIDLAATMPAHGLGELVDRAVGACAGDRARATLLSRLAAAAAARRRGAPRLRHALAPWQEGVEQPRQLQSVLEARVMRLLLDSGLPLPEPQHRVVLPALGTVYLDFAWPAERVALEVDGYAFHSSRPTFENDRLRGNLLLVEGWNVLHTTAGEVRDEPGALVAALSATLGTAHMGVSDHPGRGQTRPRPAGADGRRSSGRN
jgi:predicted transcriptional regulator of viral defense system